MAFFQAMEYHEGERLMHEKLHLTERDNPTVPMLSPQAANMLMRGPLLALGTLDDEGRPWTSLWGGEKGFSRPLGNSVIGIRTPVASTLDPVAEILLGKHANGEVVQEAGQGRMVAGLSIDLQTRKRVKLAGRMMAGALESTEAPDAGSDEHPLSPQGLCQLVLRIEQSLGNCPKYLNSKEIIPAFTAPRLISEAVPLTDQAVKLIQRTDLFFMSTSHSEHDMDTNHRGGAPGFVRVVPSSDGVTKFVWPEYSGNRLYQSLGNLMTDPKAGFCFPDFDTGDCLYITGTTQVLFGNDADALMPRSNLAVVVTITAARLVAGVLPFRGHSGELSPYNPVVRPLASEGLTANIQDSASNNCAKLLEQTPLTSTISRFRFSLANAATYTAGQYVTLDCSEHLDIGYSHMRDDDPRSLNDDFIRTFTVSSPPGLPPHPTKRLADDEFEITIRKVGVVTGFLFEHGLPGKSADLEVGVKGFGGEFMVKQDTCEEVVCFIGAGVGITPLMPSLSSLDLKRLRLLWSVRRDDLGLAASLLAEHTSLADALVLFVTGTSSETESEQDFLQQISAAGARVEYRRMQESDVKSNKQDVKRWYICTGVRQREGILPWLDGQEVLYEDYNF